MRKQRQKNPPECERIVDRLYAIVADAEAFLERHSKQADHCQLCEDVRALLWQARAFRDMIEGELNYYPTQLERSRDTIGPKDHWQAVAESLGIPLSAG